MLVHNAMVDTAAGRNGAGAYLSQPPLSGPERHTELHPASSVSLSSWNLLLSAFCFVCAQIMAGLIDQLDQGIAEFLSGWNIYSTILTLALLGFVGYVIYDTQDADTHPLLLARQAQASYVRQPGESAIFRSPEIPHGCMNTLPLAAPHG